MKLHVVISNSQGLKSKGDEDGAFIVINVQNRVGADDFFSGYVAEEPLVGVQFKLLCFFFFSFFKIILGVKERSNGCRSTI